MRNVCGCGFDCQEFIARHDIAEGARLQCPECDGQIEVARSLQATAAASATFAEIDSTPAVASAG